VVRAMEGVKNLLKDKENWRLVSAAEYDREYRKLKRARATSPEGRPVRDDEDSGGESARVQ